jgi:hypothetical protein
MSNVNIDKISRSLTASKVLSDIVYIFSPQVKDKPFYTLDNNDSLIGRSLGAGLSTGTVLTKDYPIDQQKIALELNTTAGVQTITYSTPVDLSSNFFNSGFDSYLVFPLFIVSGASALTAAQRTINIEATDNAGVPVVFSGGALNYIMGDAPTGTENLNDEKEVIAVPLKSLFASTTKVFTFKITFNLPATVKFVIYKSALYRTYRDSWLLGSESIIFTSPTNISDDSESNDQEVRGPNNELLGIKEGVESASGSFEETLYNKEHLLVLSGDYLTEGGYVMLAPQTFTVPVGGVLTPNQLQNTFKAEDIVVEIADSSGRFSEAKVVEGGNSTYLPTKVVRYVREGTKKLRFSVADQGKSVRVYVNYLDSTRLTGKKKGVKTKISGNLIKIRANSTSFANATDYTTEKLNLVEMTTKLLSADVSATESVRLQMNYKQLIDNVDTEAGERTY